VLFAVLLFCLQFVAGRLIMSRYDFNQVRLMDDYMRTSSRSSVPKIVYIGDSTLICGDMFDNDRRTLVRLLEDTFNCKILDIHGGAFDSEVFYCFCDYIVRRGYRPAMVIMPINMNSFSVWWDENPGYRFGELKYKLNNPVLSSFITPLSIFKYNFSGTDYGKYMEKPVYLGGKYIGRIRDFEMTYYKKPTPGNLRVNAIEYYLNPIGKDHRKIRAIIKTARLMRMNSIPFLFYITPTNCMRGEKYVPGRFNSILAKNVNVIKTALHEENIPVLDLYSDLSEYAFVNEKVMSAHLNEIGRRYVAVKIAGYLRNFFKSKKEISYCRDKHLKDLKDMEDLRDKTYNVFNENDAGKRIIALTIIGNKLLQDKNYKLAARVYKIILSYDNSIADIHYNLAIASYYAGDIPGSEREFRKTLKYAPDNKSAKLGIKQTQSALKAGKAR
jgi:tetratricopeptide (TPR) repeat protein